MENSTKKLANTIKEEYLNEVEREVEFTKRVIEICEKESNYYTIGELIKKEFNKLKDGGE